MIKKFSKLLSVFLIIAVFVSNIAVVSYADVDFNGYESDINKIVEQVRDAMTNREKSLNIKYVTNRLHTKDTFSEFLDNIYDMAVSETDKSDEGDYLRYVIDSFDTGETKIATYDRINYKYDIPLLLDYYTTKRQEEIVEYKIDELIESFKFNEETTDKDKCDAIYRYIVRNVDYDRENLDDDNYTLKFTAYAALIDGKAVCQGYATLFYRIAKECGLDVRVIAGYSRDPETNKNVGHAWNIVRLGEKYYYLDSTWDAGSFIYRYYLKGNNDFKNHISNEEFETQEFKSQYPIDAKNYNGHDFEITKEKFRDVYKCLDCGYEYANVKSEYKGEKLAKGDDGKWYYIVDGVEYPNANTLIEFGGKLYYVKNGVWDKSVNNVIINFDGKYYFIRNGVWDNNYTKILSSGGKYLYIKNGLWQKTFTGFAEYEGKYRYIKNGEWKKDTFFQKVGKYEYYVKDGIRSTTNGFVKYNNEYRYLVDGVFTKVTDFVKNGKKFYYVQKGIRSDKTGFVKVGGSYYMIKKGVKSSDDTYIKYKDTYLRLSKEEYTYNGKNQKLSVKVYDSKAKTVSSKYYKVTSPKSSKKVGKYKVSVKFKSKYSGTATLYFLVVPKGTKISKVTVDKKSLKISIKKQTEEVTGYQVEYSTNKEFKSAKTVTVSKAKTTSLTLKNLKAKTAYYVRVRTYKKVGGKSYYSEWSKQINKKTK